MNIIAKNKRAFFDYEILEKFEAGLVLLGHEVKSIKAGQISLKGSFVVPKGNELFLVNALISPYKHASALKDYDPTRSRKILLRKAQIKNLLGKTRLQGLTLVPIQVYTKKRLIKLEFGLGKGKKEFDKRDKIRKKEADLKIRRELKRG